MKSKGLEMSSSISPKGTTGALAHLTKQQKQRIEAEAKPLVEFFSTLDQSSREMQSALGFLNKSRFQKRRPTQRSQSQFSIR